MREFDVNVGDICRIRDWDDMAAEFGVNEWGDIPCAGTFIPEMKCFCGKVYTIAECHYATTFNKLSYAYYDLNNYDENYDEDCDDIDVYTITADMLEPVSDEEEFEHLDITLDLSLLF